MKRRIPTEEEAEKIIKEYPTFKDYVKANSETEPEDALAFIELSRYYLYCKYIVHGPDASD